MPGLKKCYYEVLGVERNATDEEIKKSYRRLALQLHPDKNPSRLEESKAEFQLLQQAYGVLSNPQERAWYDEHRHSVLREGLGDDDSFDDDTIDLMPFCTSSCYKGFGDDENGFFTVYRELFNKIIADEIEGGMDAKDAEDVPSFGDSTSSYENVTGPFYAYWEAFCTKKSFAWVDEYDTRHAENRRVSRLMEKENKKVRVEAKKDWNQRVRALVDFVKRKDKRIQTWKVQQEVKLKEKEAALAKKSLEEKRLRLNERKKMLEQHAKSKTDNTSQIKEMESWVLNEYGDNKDEDGSSSEDETYLHCQACNKVFRTEKAFQNHEKSKKHIAQVQSLRKFLVEEDEQFEESEESGDEHEHSDHTNHQASEDEGADVPDVLKNENGEGATTNSDTEVRVLAEELPESDKAKSKNLNGSEDLTKSLDSHLNSFSEMKITNEPDSEDPNDETSSHVQPESLSDKNVSETKQKNDVKKRRRADPSKKAASTSSGSQACAHEAPEQVSSKGADCHSCRKHFGSKTLLFQHLKQNPSHALPKDQLENVRLINSENKKKGKKGKHANK